MKQNNHPHSAKEDLLRLWERLVLAHQRWRADASAQCAWTILKLAASMLYQLARLYIRSR